VRFLWAKGLSAKDIRKEMFPVYGGKCLSLKEVHSWVEKFSQGRWKVADDAPPGRPVEISTEAIVQRDSSQKNFCAAGFDALLKR
jgi:transposase